MHRNAASGIPISPGVAASLQAAFGKGMPLLVIVSKGVAEGPTSLTAWPAAALLLLS